MKILFEGDAGYIDDKKIRYQILIKEHRVDIRELDYYTFIGLVLLRKRELVAGYISDETNDIPGNGAIMYVDTWTEVQDILFNKFKLRSGQSYIFYGASPHGSWS